MCIYIFMCVENEVLSNVGTRSFFMYESKMHLIYVPVWHDIAGSKAIRNVQYK